MFRVRSLQRTLQTFRARATQGKIVPPLPRHDRANLFPIVRTVMTVYSVRPDRILAKAHLSPPPPSSVHPPRERSFRTLARAFLSDRNFEFFFPALKTNDRPVGLDFYFLSFFKIEKKSILNFYSVLGCLGGGEGLKEKRMLRIISSFIFQYIATHKPMYLRIVYKYLFTHF